MRWYLMAIVLAAFVTTAAAAADEASMATVLRRLEALEQQNRELTAQVEELQRREQTRGSAVAQVQAPAIVPAAMVTPESEGEPAVRFNGDLRFRHESIDNEQAADVRTRETIRARFGATLRLNDSVDGEIALASGGLDPRGGSATLGAASSRKEIGLDLAYMNWHPFARDRDLLTVTAGKMRQPFVRPGLGMFIDNEIRPEGIATTYKDARGLFGSAFRFWLEERAGASDSMLTGGQLGWAGTLADIKTRFGVGYYDYSRVQGRFPGFGNGILSELGNTVVGAGAAARYLYDYDIAQAFAEATVMIGHMPLSLYVDYARNSAADNGLDTAYDIGLLAGKASSPGRWEAGVLVHRVEKDALFGQWTDSDFAGGVTDNEGLVYRVAWMALKNVLVNVTYLDTAFNVDVGPRTDYDRWQLDFNFVF